MRTGVTLPLSMDRGAAVSEQRLPADCSFEIHELASGLSSATMRVVSAGQAPSASSTVRRLIAINSVREVATSNALAEAANNRASGATLAR